MSDLKVKGGSRVPVSIATRFPTLEVPLHCAQEEKKRVTFEVWVKPHDMILSRDVTAVSSVKVVEPHYLDEHGASSLVLMNFDGDELVTGREH